MSGGLESNRGENAEYAEQLAREYFAENENEIF